MRSLYSTIMEARTSKTASREQIKWILRELGLWDHVYDKEDGQVTQSSDDYWFILKKTSAEYNQLCIRAASWDDFIQWCKDEDTPPQFSGITGQYGQKGITRWPGQPPIKTYLTSKTIGPKIDTRDQELATCIVFNALAHDQNQTLDEATIRRFLIEMEVDFPKDWIISFSKQVQKLVDVLGDISEYRMARYGGYKQGKKYEKYNDPVCKAYEKMIQSYTKFHTHSKKDNWDPTDVILYKAGSAGELVTEFSSMEVTEFEDRVKGAAQCEEIMSYLKNTIYSAPIGNRIFMGLSLKKLNPKSNPSFELYNMEEGDRINVTGFDQDSNRKSKKEGNVFITNQSSCVVLDGQYRFENMMDENGNEVDFKSHKITLTLRTFGHGIIGMDVNLESGPPIGKVSTQVWKPILAKKTNKRMMENEFKFWQSGFINFMNDNPDFKLINEMVQSGAKNGPRCLPFVMLH